MREKDDLKDFLDDKEVKSIRVDFKNKCGRLDLSLKGKNAIKNSLKIMKAFDEGCKEAEQEE
jgi:hypothetical protein